jgi:lipoyl synthase
VEALLQADDKKESPQYLRISLAAAMTLGFKKGLFYRDARLYCINLLLTYEQGCAARCAYCGLSGNRPGEYGEKSFIRVVWPLHRLEEIAERIDMRRDAVKRICISMITHKRAATDAADICGVLRKRFDIPVSILVSPTIINRDDLNAFKAGGADKIGVAVDLATQALFDRFRGSGVNGPHRWETYWKCLEDAVDIFGDGNAGPHFMTGMGETEKEMCFAIQRARDIGGRTHLFSFFPEAGSMLEKQSLPPMDQYRRIQVARYVIDEKITNAADFVYDTDGRVADFALPVDRLDEIINSGQPFRTSGCSGYDGEVACNRPYANSRPGEDIRNYPFAPDKEDIEKIRGQLNR